MKLLLLPLLINTHDLLPPESMSLQAGDEVFARLVGELITDQPRLSSQSGAA
jgi:hypothetical protein